MKHLTPEEFVDALEAPASGAEGHAHLRECESCREELAALRTTIDDARAVEPVEPSPLFWDHFSARVKEATAEVPSRNGFWASFGWKPAAALLVGAAALVIGLTMRPANQPEPTGSELATALPSSATVATPSIEEDSSWTLVMALAAELEWKDVVEAAAPAQGTADAMIDDLTDEQRIALVKMLEKGIGDL